MTRSLLAVGAVALAQIAAAQLTLGEEWLIGPGYEVSQAVDTAYVDTERRLTFGGSNLNWEFGEIVANDSFHVAATAAPTAGASLFDDADLLLKFRGRNDVDPTFAILAPAADVFVKRNGGKLQVIGLLNSDGLGITPPSRFATPLTFQASPLTFESSGADSTSEVLYLDPAELSVALGVPLLAAADSVEVTISQLVEYEVDAWGTLTLDGEALDALRQTRTTRTSQTARAKLGGTWRPLDAALAEQAPTGLALGALRYANFAWIVPGEPYPVVQITRDLETDALVLAQTTRTVGPTSTRTAAYPELALSASRESGVATVVLAGTPTRPLRSARLTVHGVGGKVVYERAVDAQTGRWSIDAGAWPAGRHLVSLWEGNLLVKTVVF